MKEISFFALGGQDERGKNLYVLRVEDEYVIFDSGIKYPEKNIVGVGVDLIMPNIEFLSKNLSKIKGIFISNPSAINSGAVNHVLKECDTKVYCDAQIIEIIKFKASRYRLKVKPEQFLPIKEKDVVDFGKFKVEVFKTTSGFPHSYGFVIYTKLGNVVYASDFIMDGNEGDYFKTDLNHLTEISKKGISTLICDSEYASRLDYTVPNHRIEKYLSKSFNDKKKRVILAIFEEDIFKVFEAAKLATETERQIAIYGKTLAKALENPNILKSVNLEKKQLFSIKEFTESENGVMIISGTGDGLYTRLAKIATGNDEEVEFTENDIVILANPLLAGVEKRHAEILDELARTDAKIISLSDKQSFLPIKGLYKDLLMGEKAALESGVQQGNTLILDNGQVANITDTGTIYVSDEKVNNGDVFIDGIGDVGAMVLNERRQLGNDGSVIIGVNIDIHTKEIVSLIDIQMRGVMYISDENAIFNQLQKSITLLLEKNKEDFKAKEISYDSNNIKREIISKVKGIIKKETDFGSFTPKQDYFNPALKENRNINEQQNIINNDIIKPRRERREQIAEPIEIPEGKYGDVLPEEARVEFEKETAITPFGAGGKTREIIGDAKVTKIDNFRKTTSPGQMSLEDFLNDDEDETLNDFQKYKSPMENKVSRNSFN
ncbi:hypothetical protein FQR65_LT15360 [Abscondita terminalis]|nr:hypothetical protein FQR65_LT15360 [Abscondita terminalis]